MACWRKFNLVLPSFPFVGGVRSLRMLSSLHLAILCWCFSVWPCILQGSPPFSLFCQSLPCCFCGTQLPTSIWLQISHLLPHLCIQCFVVICHHLNHLWMLCTLWHSLRIGFGNRRTGHCIWFLLCVIVHAESLFGIHAKHFILRSICCSWFDRVRRSTNQSSPALMFGISHEAWFFWAVWRLCFLHMFGTLAFLSGFFESDFGQFV